eukprot:CAMPEP_0167786570 /NCGR_PEP_ID=MMETSP0111_2-20121227/8874_1 /TAXON_ID=91324 /ORGANISM="Lotharella globosa, Strain CCCM811" /LENGTH=53 /DNA_ID=CAMNT_0007677983 /DNA_START=276 /DNA_END=437 /DNA_ORIENTATION=+
MPMSNEANPIANDMNTPRLSSCMPSTARSTDPSGPLRARFVAKTDSTVEPATQ